MRYFAAFAVLLVVLASACTSTGYVAKDGSGGSVSYVNACEAGKYAGKQITAKGYVADVVHNNKSNTVFLNFERPYPENCFTAVIFSSDLGKFPGVYMYENRTMQVTGTVKIYQDKPEIILEDPSQISLGQPA